MITFFNLAVEVNGSNPFSTLSGFTLMQRYDSHHKFELRVPLETYEHPGTDTLDRSKSLVGQSIKFTISGASASGGAGTRLSEFNGVIYQVSVARSGGSASDLVIRGFSPTIILEHGKNTKAFDNQSVSNIVRTITSRLPGNGITFHINPSTDPHAGMVLQYKESAYNFIARLANRHGQWFFFNGTDCYFGAPPSGTTTELRFGTDLHSFQLGMAIAPTKFKTTVHDYLQDTTLSAGPQSVSHLDQLGRSAFNSSESYFFDEQVFNSEQNLQDASSTTTAATNRRAAIAGGLVTITGSSNNAALKIGGTISVKADSIDHTSTTDYGTYIVTALTHSMDGRGSYQNNFEAIPSALQTPPPITGVVQPICETQTAKVIDVGDPNSMGRVKVRFYWQDDSEHVSLGVRVGMPMAGQNHGFLFTPEVGDEVIVAFLNDNPDKPIIVGSVYNGNNNQSDRTQQDNSIKTIRTKAGNEIKFNDKQGEEEILITSPNSSHFISVTMKDGGKIHIESQGKLELKANEITIEAQQDLSLSGANIKIAAQQKLSASGNSEVSIKSAAVNVDSDGNVSISGNGDVKLDGTNVDIAGKVGATVKGNATAELSASGQTAVKGGVVMIN